MQTDDVTAAFARLVRAGLEAAGSPIDVVEDEGMVCLRDVFVETSEGFRAFRVADPSEPFAAFPAEAAEAAAVAACMDVLSGAVARGVEREGRR